MLRLNYRGSTGYGRDFLEAGKGTMFARLQQDVLDAARWAVDGGHAAEGRIALLGASFGGFLVLTMLVRHPEAFQAGVAVNGITDTVTFWKREWQRSSHRVLWREFLASNDLPEAALARISPVNNVRKLDAPVLLLVGTRDRRVPAEYGFELFDLLRAVGKRAELIEYRGRGHELFGDSRDIREHAAGALTEFLDKHLPVDRQ